MSLILKSASWLLTHVALALLYFFNFIRPVLGNVGACKFDINCADVARISFSIYPIHKACIITAKQLLCCHPFERPLKRLVNALII